MKTCATSWLTISGSKVLLCLAGSLLVVCSAMAQEEKKQTYNIQVAEQLKDVTATGPYPIYIRLQPLLFSYGNTDTRRIFGAYDHYQKSIDIPHTMWGFNVDAGLRFRKIFGEVGFTQMGRKKNSGDQSLALREQFCTIRIGYVMSRYYPISYQFTLGAVFGNTAMIITDPTSTQQVKHKVTIGESPLKGRAGIEGGARLVLMDPVGAGGGLGIFFECRFLCFFEPLNYGSFGQALGTDQLQTMESDQYFGTLSVGIIAPLAYRLHLTPRKQ